MTEPLYRLVYRSDCFLLGSDESVRADLDSILALARTRNEGSNVTGCLTLANSVFVQVLEGSMASLEATFERICCDVRHLGLSLLEMAPIEQRTFSGWPMAEITPEPETAALLSLLTAQEQSSSSMEQAEATVKLLRAILSSSSNAAPRHSDEAAAA